jgi:hypothetical protein
VTSNRSESPFAFGAALAPAVVGAVSALLGLAVFRFIAREVGPPEEAAIRLFGVIFLALGVALLNVGAGAIYVLGARRRGAGSVEPPVALLALTTAVSIGLLAPLHLWWRAPWPAFQNTVLVLDGLAGVLVVWLIARLVRRGTPSRPVATAAAARARSRWMLAAIFFGMTGAMVGWLGARQAAADWRAWSSLRPAAGLVLRQHSFNFRDPDRGTVSMGAAVVQYSVDGKGFEATLPMDPASPQFRRGARVDLLYNPAQPGSARLASAFHVFLLGGVLLVAAISFLGLAAVALARANTQ